MRKTLRIHLLLHLLGFDHPDDIFQRGRFADLFRQLLAFTASVCFKSVEAFARMCHTEAAMVALQEAPLIPAQPKQKSMCGNVFAQQCMDAQRAARNLPTENPLPDPARQPFVRWISEQYGNVTLDEEEWSAFAVKDVVAGILLKGNHVCRSDVCLKGRHAKRGWCRMIFYRHERYGNAKGTPCVRVAKGQALVPAWNGEGLPPVIVDPPRSGFPALEVNHGSAIKSTPGVLRGGRCNHDCGLLIK